MMPLNQVLSNVRIAFSQGVLKGPDLRETAVLLAISAGSGVIVRGSSEMVYHAGSIAIDIKNIVKEFFLIAKHQQVQLENEVNSLLEKIKALHALIERDQEHLEATQEALKRAYDIEEAAQTIILQHEEEQQELLRRLNRLAPQINEVTTIMGDLQQMAEKANSPQEIQTQMVESLNRIKQMGEEIAARKALETQPLAAIIPLRA